MGLVSCCHSRDAGDRGLAISAHVGDLKPVQELTVDSDSSFKQAIVILGH